MEKVRKHAMVTAILFAVFIVFTIAVKYIDVKPIGPQASKVGFATLNGFVFKTVGVHDFWHSLTGCFGAVSIALALCVVALGIAQLVIRKELRKVDMEIILLCGFYVLVFAFYLLFEVVEINCRPILEDGVLEASYPSSHTMLVCCIMSTLFPVLSRLFQKNGNVMKVCEIASSVIILVTVVGRMISGVHWFTDIAGAVLLSAALIWLFYTVYEYTQLRLKGRRHF